MSGDSCATPVEGWGGAGDACARALWALESVDHALEALGTAFPEQWSSVAADGYRERLEELLAAGRRVRNAVVEVGHGARSLAVDVAAWYAADH